MEVCRFGGDVAWQHLMMLARSLASTGDARCTADSTRNSVYYG
jgi:hypothetical protein